MAKGKKTGGRVKGAKNKASGDVEGFCQKLLTDPVYRASFKQRFQEGKLAPAVECMVWHYGAGKPTEHHKVTGADGGPVEHRVTFVVKTS